MTPAADTRSATLTRVHEDLVAAGLTACAIREAKAPWPGDSALVGAALVAQTRERIAEGAVALEVRLSGTGIVAVEVEGPNKHDRGGPLIDLVALAGETDLDPEVLRRASEALATARSGWSHATPSQGWRAYVRCIDLEPVQVSRSTDDGGVEVLAEILPVKAICAGDLVVNGQVTGVWGDQVGGPASIATWSPADATAVVQLMAATSDCPQPSPSSSLSAGVFDRSKRAQAVDARLVEQPDVWRAALVEAGWAPADERGGWSRPGSRSRDRHALLTQSALIVYTTSDAVLPGASNGVRYRPLELMMRFGRHDSIEATIEKLEADGTVPAPPVQRSDAGRPIARFATVRHTTGYSQQPTPVTQAELAAIAEDLLEEALIACSGSVSDRSARMQLDARVDSTVIEQLDNLIASYERWVLATCAEPREVTVGDEKDGQVVYGLWPTDSVVFAREGTPVWELRRTHRTRGGDPPTWAVFPASATARQGLAVETGTYALGPMADQFITPQRAIRPVWRSTSRVASQPVRIEQVHRITDATGAEVATAKVRVGSSTTEVPAAVMADPRKYLAKVGSGAMWCDVGPGQIVAAVAGASQGMVEIRSVRAAGWRGPAGKKTMTTQGVTVDGVTTDFRAGAGPVERLAQTRFAEPLPRAEVSDAARQVRDAWRSLDQPHAVASLMSGAVATLMIGVASVIYLWGGSGSRKTSLANLFRSATSLSAVYSSHDISAASSSAGIRSQLAGGHHQMALLDDWASGSIRGDHTDQLGELARQMIGGAAPAKATQGGRARSDVPLPDAVLFATGEQPIAGGSASAEGRLIQVEMGSISLAAADAAWTDVGGWDGVWSRLYATFVAWLEANDIESFSAEVRRRVPVDALSDDPRVHPQTAAAHAALDASLEVWGDFLADMGCDEDLVGWAGEMRADLLAAVLDRREYAGNTSTGDQFTENLRRALLMGDCHLSGPDGASLDGEAVAKKVVWHRLGWRERVGFQGAWVGWVGDGLAYLTSDAFVAANDRAKRDKVQEPGSAVTVRKALHKAGAIRKRDKTSPGHRPRLTYKATTPHGAQLPTTVVSLDLILGEAKPGAFGGEKVEW
jgi:hypothetical protein